MLLTDSDIRRYCTSAVYTAEHGPMIDPFSEAVSGNGIIGYGLSSCGYDVRLGNEIWYLKSTGEVIDPKRFRDENYRNLVMDRRRFEDGERVILPSNGYLLGVTKERFCTPNQVCGQCIGKSTYARVGVLVNVTPIEPGWAGYLTVEVANTGPAPVAVYVGEGIAQIQFHVLTARPEKTYKDKNAGSPGKYQDQVGVTMPRVL